MLRRTLVLALVALALLASGCQIWLRPAVVYTVGYYYPAPPPPVPEWWYDYWCYYYWSCPSWCFYDYWHCHHHVWVDIHYHYYEWWPDPPRRYRSRYYVGHKKYRAGRYAEKGEHGGRNLVATIEHPRSIAPPPATAPAARLSKGTTTEQRSTKERPNYGENVSLRPQDANIRRQKESSSEADHRKRGPDVQDRVPNSARSVPGSDTGRRGSAQPDVKPSEIGKPGQEWAPGSKTGRAGSAQPDVKPSETRKTGRESGTNSERSAVKKKSGSMSSYSPARPSEDRKRGTSANSSALREQRGRVEPPAGKRAGSIAGKPANSSALREQRGSAKPSEGKRAGSMGGGRSQGTSRRR